MDKLKDKYFSDPKAYGKAMELLMLYDLNSESSSWEDFEVNFLMKLDEDEDNLLGKALKMSHGVIERRRNEL